MSDNLLLVKGRMGAIAIVVYKDVVMVFCSELIVGIDGTRSLWLFRKQENILLYQLMNFQT